MRIFVASMATETNTFSPIPTSLQTFKETLYFPPGTHPDYPTLCSAPVWLARKVGGSGELTVIDGSSYWAEPSGTVARDAYEAMRDEILEQLRTGLPVDGILLGLHGAMVAHGYDDCEGDLLARIRAIIGNEVPIGVELDPHCHLTPARLEHADILVCFKEYPHTDFADRAADLLRLLIARVQREISPVMSVYDCRTVGTFPTTMQPMRGFVDRMKKLEQREGVLSISMVHGYPYADVPEAGARVLVITDDCKTLGDQLATELGQQFVSIRDQLLPTMLTVDQAIDRATACSGMVSVIADASDNAGGGAPSDSTHILRRLLDRGVAPAAIGPIWDPVAVRFCMAAGEGSTIALRFGGKIAATSGAPIDAQVHVRKLAPAAWQTFGRSRVPLGDAALIRVEGVDIVLISSRTQAYGTDLFTGLGVNLKQCRVIVVKSMNHFHAAFAPIADEILYCDAGGLLSRDFRKLPYTRVRRPIWPLDEGATGALWR